MPPGQERVGIGLLVREVFEKLAHHREGFGDLMLAGQHLIERIRFSETGATASADKGAKSGAMRHPSRAGMQAAFTWATSGY
jgi:hypothetical protein